MPGGAHRRVSSVQPEGRLLVAFTRYPVPGNVKTRLIPALGPAGAAQLQRQMTERTLARVAVAPANVRSWDILIRFEGGDCEAMKSWLGEAHRSLPQGPGTLGERLRRVFAEGFAGGAAAIVVIGTDCPDLGAADVADAFRALEDHDTVFGPARDGGYWLIGLRQRAFAVAAAPLFTGIPWGGNEVFAASREAGQRAGLCTCCLRTLTDVDRPADLPVWECALRGDAAGEAISVVVPALNEAERLGGLLNGLGAEDGVEVIVADGGSSDGTPAVAAGFGARVVCGSRGRASQMNAGAAAATAPLLLFLHADTRLPSGWAAAVRDLMRQPGLAGGAFSFATDSPRRSLRFIEAAAKWRSRLLGVFFGDQALFVRRSIFAALGGFPDQPLLEDYELVRRLRQRGRVIVLPQPAVTSARRWEERGPWRNSCLNALLTAAYLLGVSPKVLCRWYRGRQ